VQPHPFVVALELEAPGKDGIVEGLAVVTGDRRELAAAVNGDVVRVRAIERGEGGAQLGVQRSGDHACDATLENSKAVASGDLQGGGRGGSMVGVTGDACGLEDNEQCRIPEVLLDDGLEDRLGYLG